MKIVARITLDPQTVGDTDMNNIGLTALWALDTGISNQSVQIIPWSIDSTATTLNATAKAAVIADIQYVANYTYDPVNDQLFIVAGFV